MQKNFTPKLARGIWFLILTTLVGGGLFLWSQQSQSFPIKQIIWSPNVDASQTKQIQQVVAPLYQRSFWQVDLAQLQSELIRLSWVRDSTIERQWPGTLKIHLVLQKPVARWQDRGLVNDAGEIYYPLDEQAGQDLARLAGDETESAKILQALVHFQTLLTPVKMTIAQLTLTPADVWQIKLLDGHEILLKAQDLETEQRVLQRFIRAYPKIDKKSLKFAHEFDLRYSNGFVIQFHAKDAQLDGR